MEPILNVIKEEAPNLHPTALGVLVLSLFQMLTQASKLMPKVLNIGSEIIETFYQIRSANEAPIGIKIISSRFHH